MSQATDLAADRFLAQIATEPRGTRPSVQALPATWSWDDNDMLVSE